MKNLNKKLTLALLTIIPALSSSAHADSEGISGLGNGGDVRVCFNNKVDFQTVLRRIKVNKENNDYQDVLEGINLKNVEVRLFDFVSAEKRGVFDEPQNALIELPGSVRDIVENRINVFAEKTDFDKTLREVIEGPLANENWIPSSTGVIEIDDSNQKTNMPSNCMLVQIAVQTDLGVNYDDRLFGELSTTEKAGLIIHETAYYLARQSDKIRNSKKAPAFHTNSTAVRAFTSKLFSKDISTASGGALITWLQSNVRLLGHANRSYIKLEILGTERTVVEFEGAAFYLVERMKERFSNGGIKYVHLKNPEFFGRAQIVDPNSIITLYPDGKIKNIFGNFNYQDRLYKTGTFLQDTGNLRSATFISYDKLQGISVKLDSYVGFHLNGRLAFFILGEDQVFPTRSGKSVEMKSNDYVQLDQDGYVDDE